MTQLFADIYLISLNFFRQRKLRVGIIILLNLDLRKPQAFLLFTTNLVGIVLAASFTFRILGYSPAIRGKQNIGIVLLLSALVAIPLYLSYDRIVEKAVYEKNWREERFLVNEKYIIIQKANFSRRGNKMVIDMDILTRERLTRHDLNEFRRKIQTNFSKEIVIRAKTIYIP